MSPRRRVPPPLNEFCKRGHHDFVSLAAPGWFQCDRSDCRVYGVCPFCHGCLPAGVLVQPCHLHTFQAIEFAGEGGSYPVCSAPGESEQTQSVSYEQSSLW